MAAAKGGSRDLPELKVRTAREDRGDPTEFAHAVRDAKPRDQMTICAFPDLRIRISERLEEDTVPCGSKAEMLSWIIEEYQDYFPVIFGLASVSLQLVFGIDVKKVDARDHSSVLVTTLGLTYDGMVSDGHSMPKTSLLVMLLGLILLESNCALKEDIWEELCDMEVYVGREHCIYGAPRELITYVWVWEQYVVYRQVTNSCPARYEFL
ncbi:melanoma-associated antigen 9-like [Rousettus aegyptiacus]|uniref:melanoma-associated antigen 9-like n=1 Tax=Rousettus aegyptiacus TaxID=9407 RepID=UPI00168D78AE|nr:melanoma-associated antigen 9-like [Rousettus aegyptiacus]